MNCAEFESILADYFDGTLPETTRVAFEQHADGCESCREFMTEARAGLEFLEQASPVEPPPELITRIAFLAPVGRTREPFERRGFFGKIHERWVQPLLQPRLAMGMAMTILSFAMLERCTGVHVQHLEPADLSPVRVWGEVEDKALRVRDQAVKYYNSLRIVYEIESHLSDLEEQSQAAPQARNSKADSNGGGTANRPRNQGDKP